VKSSCDLLIIGAGAAGIGAAHAAQSAQLDYIVVEASHRVGGRGLTEELAPGIPWDLGCHWLHSGSINPLVNVADCLGFHYNKTTLSRDFHLRGQRLSNQEIVQYQHFAESIWNKIKQLDKDGEDAALSELIDHSSPWAAYYSYWQSLMTSQDVDQFSALDLVRYKDTNENWPLREGFGRLLQQHAAGLNIGLNTAVKRIDWGGDGVIVETSRGSIKAKRAIITVSTGVLGARDIQFIPDLPLAKREAIDTLPLGCYNNFAMLFNDGWPFDADAPDRIDFSDGNDINFAFKLRCSNWPYIYCAVAGRQARWLERQPIGMSQELMTTALVSIFGSGFERKITTFKSSAWGSDGWIKGAFSASKPGHANQRSVLAEPLANRLFFAGEATSINAFCTAHGAWQSGQHAVKNCTV